MRLHLPAYYKDLTLGMLQVIETTEDPLLRVSAVAEIPLEELRTYPFPLIRQANEYIDHLRTKETSRHEATFDLNGTRYGFIPNWDEFTTGEWIDAEQYAVDFWANAHKMMSILFRPVVREFKDRYEIEPYTAKEDAEVFKSLPADQVSGALLFFSITKTERLNTLRSSLIATMKAIRTSLPPNGDGIPSSTHWLKRTFSGLRRSLNSRLGTSSRTSHS